MISIDFFALDVLIISVDDILEFTMLSDRRTCNELALFTGFSVYYELLSSPRLIDHSASYADRQ
jgi:hypothetical protein